MEQTDQSSNILDAIPQEILLYILSYLPHYRAFAFSSRGYLRLLAGLLRADYAVYLTTPGGQKSYQPLRDKKLIALYAACRARLYEGATAADEDEPPVVGSAPYEPSRDVIVELAARAGMFEIDAFIRGAADIVGFSHARDMRKMARRYLYAFLDIGRCHARASGNCGELCDSVWRPATWRPPADGAKVDPSGQEYTSGAPRGLLPAPPGIGAGTAAQRPTSICDTLADVMLNDVNPSAHPFVAFVEFIHEVFRADDIRDIERGKRTFDECDRVEALTAELSDSGILRPQTEYPADLLAKYFVYAMRDKEAPAESGPISRRIIAQAIREYVPYLGTPATESALAPWVANRAPLSPQWAIPMLEVLIYHRGADMLYEPWLEQLVDICAVDAAEMAVVSSGLLNCDAGICNFRKQLKHSGLTFLGAPVTSSTTFWLKGFQHPPTTVEQATFYLRLNNYIIRAIGQSYAHFEQLYVRLGAISAHGRISFTNALYNKGALTVLPFARFTGAMGYIK